MCWLNEKHKKKIQLANQFSASRVQSWGVSIAPVVLVSSFIPLIMVDIVLDRVYQHCSFCIYMFPVDYIYQNPKNIDFLPIF